MKVGGVGQLFFAYRIWMISNEMGPPIAISVVSQVLGTRNIYYMNLLFILKVIHLIYLFRIGFFGIFLRCQKIHISIESE